MVHDQDIIRPASPVHSANRSDNKEDSNLKTDIHHDSVVDEVEEIHIRKNFRWYELVCVCFCANNVPAVIGLLLSINYTNGGIPSLVWGNLLCWCGALMVALRIAEMASVVPTVGGAYHHAIWLAPTRHKAFFGWITGLINFFGWLFNSSSTALLAGQGIIGFVQIVRDGFVIERWALWLIAVGLYGPMLVINIWGIKYVGRLDIGIVLLQVIGVTGLLIAIMAYSSPLASAEDVFKTVIKSEPGNSIGNSLMLGFFTGATLASGLDGGAHLAEEVKKPRRVIPRIIIAVVSSGLFFAFVFGIMYGFASNDIAEILSYQAFFPIVIRAKNVLNSPAAAHIFNFIITIVALVGAMGSLLISSRQLMSLAQDGMFPVKWRLHVVHPTLRLPINSLLLCAFLCCLFNLIYLSGSAGWNAVNALCLVSFNSSYALVVGLGIWRGRDALPANRQFKLPKRVGQITDALGLTYELFSFIVLFYPGNIPTNMTNFNWGLVAELGLMGLILVGWFTYGRYHYEAVDVEHLSAIVDRRDELEDPTH